MRLTSLGALALLTSSALAQGAISGVVSDTGRRALADAEVIIESVNRRVRTDSAGAFTIAGLDAGTYQLRTRRLGYFVDESRARVSSGAAITVRITLQARPVLMDTVQVTADCDRFNFSGFVCRRRGSNGRGVFFDANAIDSANPRYPVDLLREMPAFRVVAVRHGLGVQSLTGWRCVVEVVNGRKPSLLHQKPKWPKDMVGMEVYADPDDIPGEYRHFTERCSLIVYWTEARPRR